MPSSELLDLKFERQTVLAKFIDPAGQTAVKRIEIWGILPEITSLQQVTAADWQDLAQGVNCLPDTKWICISFEIDVHAAGDSDFRKPHSRSTDVS